MASYKKPDCPNCGEGVLEPREYVECETDYSDEIRYEVRYCPKCEWIIGMEDW